MKIRPIKLDINLKKMPRKLSTREILEQNLSREKPYKHGIIVWAHNIRSLHNIGAIFRSCDAFGIDEVILSGYSPTPDRPEVNKTAIGAEEYVSWRFEENWENVIQYLKSREIPLIALEQTEGSVALPVYQPPTDSSVCLLLGNEVSGVDEKILAHVQTCVEIPQYGHKHSLNVSVAAGILLYDLLCKSWRQKNQV
jgi:tRNA G18 (ribose-2'-O)-methylase SpoU